MSLLSLDPVERGIVRHFIGRGRQVDVSSEDWRITVVNQLEPGRVTAIVGKLQVLGFRVIGGGDTPCPLCGQTVQASCGPDCIAVPF